jgi:hypothetical protein
VDPKNSYSRIVAVVPLTGTGTPTSPKRPEYAPWPLPTPTAQSSITAFYWVPTDDGKSAIVEFVAPDMTAFKQILADKTITIFVRGKDSKSTIEAALQLHKKGFSLESFGMVL